MCATSAGEKGFGECEEESPRERRKGIGWTERDGEIKRKRERGRPEGRYRWDVRCILESLSPAKKRVKRVRGVAVGESGLVVGCSCQERSVLCFCQRNVRFTFDDLVEGVRREDSESEGKGV